MTEEKKLVNAIIEGIQDRKGKSIVHVDMSAIRRCYYSWFRDMHRYIDNASERNS